MITNTQPIEVSGSRFLVRYLVQGDEADAYSLAKKICIEETIEYPEELVSAGDIRDHIFGRIEDFNPAGKDKYDVTISYADEISGFEFPQLLNVIFGNISMMPGIRVLDIMLSENILKIFKGPRFGISGLRETLKVFNRPLLATAIKPMGLSAKEFGKMAYELAMGGMDIIKDDHGLANQPFAKFEERVSAVNAAVQKANEETGFETMYMPNVTGPFELMMERIMFAKKIGVQGLLLIPGYCGLDFVRFVAENDDIGLPIMAHPAFIGSYVLSPEFGVHHKVMHGKLLRLAGADMTVFPNYIGRFAYSLEDCKKIDEGCKNPMAHMKCMFPAPGGGIKPSIFKELIDEFGNDVILLMSGNLHRQGENLRGTTEKMAEKIRTICG